MNRGTSLGAGYTIVETLIFLAVTTALFAMVAVLVSGQQAKTEFDQAVRDTQQRIDSVVASLSTGLYNTSRNISCNFAVVPNTKLLVQTSGSSTQGANADCLFLGRAIQFAPQGDKPGFYTYTIVGRSRTKDDGPPVSTLLEAMPAAIAQSATDLDSTKMVTTNYPDAFQKDELEHSLSPDRMYYTDSSNVQHDISAIAFVNSLTGSVGLRAGSVPIDSYPAVGSTLNMTTKNAADHINASLNAASPVTNPEKGITLCFNSFARTNQHVDIVIGGNGRDLTSTLSYVNGATC